MKFVKRTLGDAADVSAGKDPAFKAYLRIALFVLLGFVAVNLFVWAAVEIGVRFISVEHEAALFNFIGGESDDSPELEIFRETLERLREHPGVAPYPYRLVLIEEEQPNAFAILGGAIGVTSGLVEEIKDDEIAIAFLLGHELGHFANRDHLRGAGRAVLLAGCQSLIFPHGGGDLMGGVTYAAIITAYSRRQEEQADRFGLRLVYDCYGETDGALRLMRRLHDEARIPEWAYMFTTHPGPERRIHLLESELERLQDEDT